MTELAQNIQNWNMKNAKIAQTCNDVFSSDILTSTVTLFIAKFL